MGNTYDTRLTPGGCGPQQGHPGGGRHSAALGRSAWPRPDGETAAGGAGRIGTSERWIFFAVFSRGKGEIMVDSVDSIAVNGDL